MTPTQKGLSSALRQTSRRTRPLRVLGWVMFFACGLSMAAILLSDPGPARSGPDARAAPAAQPGQPPART
jgi:hypothetical protein